MVQFPLKYVDLNHPEHDLLEISEDDWFHDIDSHHAIGPNCSDEQYILDASGKLFSVLFAGMDTSNVPSFEFQPCDDQSKLEKVKKYIQKRML